VSDPTKNPCYERTHKAEHFQISVVEAGKQEQTGTSDRLWWFARAPLQALEPALAPPLPRLAAVEKQLKVSPLSL
jgi:hypothetical protein